MSNGANMTDMATAEEAIISYLMRRHEQDRAWASNFLHRHILHAPLNDEPELKGLVVAYKNAIKAQENSGAAERHVEGVIATGRHALRERK